MQDAVESGKTDPTVADAQRLMGLLAVYMREMGIDARLLFVASLVGADEIMNLDADRLAQLGVVNVSEKGDATA